MFLTTRTIMPCIRPDSEINVYINMSIVTLFQACNVFTSLIIDD